MDALGQQTRDLLADGKIAEATTLVLQVYGPEILGFVSGVLNDSDGDEVFSAFSERLWRSLERFQWRCTLRTWVYVLARHEISRFRRGVRRHVEGRVPLSELQSVLEAVRKTHTTRASEHRSTLVRLRDELPIEDRALLILRVDRGLSFEDIALAFAEDPETTGADELKREAARLRKRFQLVKERLTARARAVLAAP